MIIQILALQNFKMITHEDSENLSNEIGDLVINNPSVEYNFAIPTLQSTEYQCEDYIVTEAGNHTNMLAFFKVLERLDPQSVLVEGWEKTTVWTGPFLSKAIQWVNESCHIVLFDNGNDWNQLTNNDVALKNYKKSDFELTYLRLSQLLNYAGSTGLIQFGYE